MAAEATPTVWTVRNLLTWTTKHFHAKGIESAAADARILLASVFECRPIEVLARYDDEPTDAERKRYRELIQRRVEGCPVAYLVGNKDFYLLSFEVNPAVLIPRPDTETLVQTAIDFLKNKPNATVLDLGTGSGCVAVSVAHGAKSATVTAVDVSPDAVEVARRNAAKHGLSGRVSVLTGDLFAPLQSGAKFDLILSNPPYIPPSEIETLDPGVKDYEPRLALDGGPDGLAFYRRIAGVAGRWLNPGGSVMVEIGWTQEPAVRGIFDERPEFTVGESVQDMGRRWRVVRAKLQ
jgi:release factor glutamine methyltransferase